MATTVLGLKTFAASDPVDYNEINDNYNKIDAGVKTAFQGRAAHNLLDNSWFVNPVNQRGKTSYSAAGYTIDRWDIARWSSDGSDTINLSIETNGIRLSGGTNSTSSPNSCFIRQKLDASKMLGKTYTIAVNVISLSGDGNGLLYAECDSTFFTSVRLKTGINIVTFTMPSSASTFFMAIGNYASEGGVGAINVLMDWAALYEGSYDASTLPAYVPKGYAAELAECQRYYREVYRVFGKDLGNVTREAIILNPQMRIPPTSTVKSLWKGNDDTSVTVNSTANDNADVTYTGWGNATIAFSADL